MNLQETTYWFNQLIPAELRMRALGALHVVMAELGDGQSMVATVDFSAFDPKLTADVEKLALRVELLAVAREDMNTVVDAVAAAAQAIIKAGGQLTAQPGLLIPQLGDAAGFSPEITVAHALFVPPYLWGGDVPRMTEPDRLTVPLQLVMLTDSEYAFAAEEGVGALQQELVAAGIDLLDWKR